MARTLQLAFSEPRTWGGRRAGAGRKPTAGRRPGVPHRARPVHVAAYPVHVTLRAEPAIACLRSVRTYSAVGRALTVSSRDGFRIMHFSVQDDHIRLIVEADDTRMLALGIRGAAIRIAFAVNHTLGRRGPVFDGRYHARALRTPREMRHCLVYVLFNRRKHCAQERGLDRCSSAPWFEGWQEPIAIPGEPSPVVRARTWLAAVGWRRHGLISHDEQPRRPHLP